MQRLGLVPLVGLLVAAQATVPSCQVASKTVKEPPVPIETRSYGKTPDGQEVREFRLVNQRGIEARLIELGALLTQMRVLDRDGKLADVVLGFDDLAGYTKNPAYFGCTTGRVANRIQDGKFTLDGQEYQLAKNNAPHHLHGGEVGLHKRLWKGEAKETPEGPSVVFRYRSPHMEDLYPGTVDMEVTYTLTQSDELRIEYRATTDRATIINLTNHSYWNLAGEGNGTILDHELRIDAQRYTAVDAGFIPTGELRPVAGTPLDFTRSTRIGARIAAIPGDPAAKDPGGYDFNYVIDGSQGGKLALAARVEDPSTGRVLEILTTEPGVQLYTGNFLDGSIIGKGGKSYAKHFAFCLETQHFPDSINHQSFPSVVLRPGEEYRSTTVHRFSTR
jgi:aldose 1-epimerase